MERTVLQYQRPQRPRDHLRQTHCSRSPSLFILHLSAAKVIGKRSSVLRLSPHIPSLLQQWMFFLWSTLLFQPPRDHLLPSLFVSSRCLLQPRLPLSNSHHFRVAMTSSTTSPSPPLPPHHSKDLQLSIHQHTCILVSFVSLCHTDI